MRIVFTCSGSAFLSGRMMIDSMEIFLLMKTNLQTVGVRFDKMISYLSSHLNDIYSRISRKSFYAFEHNDELISGREGHQSIHCILLDPELRLTDKELRNGFDHFNRM